MNINLIKTPFSAKGAYLAIQKSDPINGDGIWLRSLIRPERGTGRKKVSDQLVRFIPTDSTGVFIKYTTVCTPECLRFESNFGYVEIFFSSINSIDIKTENMGLVLEHDNDDSQLVNIEIKDNQATGYFPISFFDFSIVMHKGNFKYSSNRKRFFITCDNEAHFTVSAWHRFLSLPDNMHIALDKKQIKSDFMQFRSYYNPQCQTEEQAIYLLWSGEYERCGNLSRSVTAISKSMMNLVWSWDNCFISLALRKANKRLARDNIMLFFDLQKEDGRLLDAVNPFLKVDWFTKPPIHGFFISKLLEDEEIFDQETVMDLFPKLEKLANWWEKHTGSKKLFYYSKAFDSGWDNATCFDNGMPIYSPDLNAYMVLLYRCLCQISEKLNYTEKALNFLNQSNQVLKNMLKYLYDGKQFVCLDSEERPFETTSLIKMMPLLLGSILPSDVFANLTAEISRENHFLTENSLATESVTSELYDQRKGSSFKPNAYWRGPVWAPPVYCIYDGLVNAGYNKLAQKIAKRFISLIESDKTGIYENYDAIQKTGYDDSGYMWTAAVYLLLKERNE